MAPEVIRTATFDDIPAAAAVRASGVADSIVSAEGMRTWLGDMASDPDLLLLAADIDERMVGWCTAARNTFGAAPDVGMLDVTVVPDAQRRGIGGRLVTRGLEHLDAAGIRTVRASTPDGPAQRALAATYDFVESHASSSSAVDPRTVRGLPVPDGVALVPFGEIDDPAPLHELDLEVSPDIPGDEDFSAMTLERWTRQFWHSVFADDEASLAVYVGGELAGFTMLRVDRPTGRAQNNLTGVRRPYRGRGLAHLMKSHSLERAARAGATIAFTDNDETNAPMLAVNRALGYRHSTRRVEWERRQD